MPIYFIKICAQYSVALFGAVTLNFFLPRLAPGTPLDYILGEVNLRDMSQAEQQAVLADFGLDAPLWQQYLQYLQDICVGHFGLSVQLGMPVWDILQDRLPWTFLLSGSALILSTVIGSFLGIIAAWYRGKLIDFSAVSLCIFFGALPTFWMAMMLIILFSTELGLLPSFGAYPLGSHAGSVDWLIGVAERMILPVMALTIIHMTSVLLISRASMITVLSQDYILFARSQGCSEKRLFLFQAFRNAMLPLYTHVMMGFGAIVGGALVVETVFSYPGLGSLIVNAVSARDYPLMQGLFLITTCAVIAANFLTDLFYPMIDPRTHSPS